MPTTGPSERQAQLLRFMSDYQRREGLPPTLPEMRDFLRVKSPTAALDLLKALEKKGYVLRRARIARGSTLTYKAAKFLESHGREPA